MILITGGMGFTGLHTARRFLDAGEDVVITWYQTWREPSFLKDEYNKRVKIERVDIRSRDFIDIVKKHKPSAIVHLAVPGIGANTLSPAEDFDVNMSGLINVLEAGRLFDTQRILVASSQTVYSGLPQGPFSEDMLLPIESRGATEAYKKALETLSLHWSDRTKVPVINMRLGGIWGPLYHTLANLASRLTHAAVKGVEPNYGGRPGAPAEPPFAEDTQDWGYVKEIAQGIQRLTMTPELKHRIYNVGGGRAVPNQELVDAIKEIIPDAKIQLQPGKSPRFRPNSNMVIDRLIEDTGFKHEYTTQKAIAEYIDWLRQGNQY